MSESIADRFAKLRSLRDNLCKKEENWQKALEIQSEMILYSTLPEDKFNKEKGIIYQEIQSTQARSYYQENQVLQNFIKEGTKLTKRQPMPLLIFLT